MSVAPGNDLEQDILMAGSAQPVPRPCGETHPGNPATSVILQVSQSTAITDINGLASIAPAGGFSAPLKVDVAVTTGTGALLDYPLELLPGTSGSQGRPSPRSEQSPCAQSVRP